MTIQVTGTFVKSGPGIPYILAVSDLSTGSINEVLTSDGSVNSFNLLVNANIDPSATIDVSKLGPGTANTVLTTDGTTDSFNLLVNANIAAAAAIAISKLAAGTANRVLTTNGTTNSFTLLVNANIDAAAAIAVSKLAPGTANRVLTTDGTTDSFNLLVNANIDPSAAIDVSKLGPGTANTVLTTNGTTDSFNLLVNANIEAAAAIDVSKLAAGTANTVLTTNGTTDSFNLLVNANIATAAAIAVSKLAAGTANTVLTTNGTTDSFNLLVNANIDSAAAIAVSKLAAGTANTVLTTNGTTDSFNLLVNANIDTAAAIDVSKLAAGTANRVLTTNGTTDSFNLLVNANIDSAAAIAVSKLAAGTANTVLTTNGTTDSFNLLVNANIDSAAAISITKLAPGTANTVLTTNGTTNSFALIVNANVDSAAAIAGTKISPNFGSQNVFTTGAIVAGSASIASDSAGSLVSSNAYVAAYTYSATAAAPGIFSARRARGTRGTEAVLVQNDVVGDYRFGAYDGATYAEYAKITSKVDLAVAGNMPMDLEFYTGSTVAVLRGSITSAGIWNVQSAMTFGTGTVPATGTIRFQNASTVTYKSTQGAGGDVNAFVFDSAAGVMVVGENNSLLQTLQLRSGNSITMTIGSTSILAALSTALRIDTANLIFISSSVNPSVTVQAASTVGTQVGTTLSVKGQTINGTSATSVTGGILRLIGGAAGNTGATGTAVGGDLELDTVVGTGATTNKYGNIAIYGASPNYQTGQRVVYWGQVSVVPTGSPAAGAFMWVTANGEFETRSTGGIMALGNSLPMVLNGASSITLKSNNNEKLKIDVTGFSLFGVATVGQQTMTDNTTGTADIQLVDCTTTGLADPVKVNNNFASIRRALNRYGLFA